jgi:hypothetical protein
MNIKTMLLAAIGAAAIAAPAMAQSYYYSDDGYRDYNYRYDDYRSDHDYYGPRCWIEYHRDYTWFGFYTTHRVRVCR